MIEVLRAVLYAYRYDTLANYQVTMVVAVKEVAVTAKISGNVLPRGIEVFLETRLPVGHQPVLHCPLDSRRINPLPRLKKDDVVWFATQLHLHLIWRAGSLPAAWGDQRADQPVLGSWCSARLLQLLLRCCG